MAAVLSFYQLDREKDIGKTLRRIGVQIMNLQEYDGKKLVKVMENFDAGKS